METSPTFVFCSVKPAGTRRPSSAADGAAAATAVRADAVLTCALACGETTVPASPMTPIAASDRRKRPGTFRPRMERTLSMNISFLFDHVLEGAEKPIVNGEPGR